MLYIRPSCVATGLLLVRPSLETGRLLRESRIGIDIDTGDDKNLMLGNLKIKINLLDY